MRVDNRVTPQAAAVIVARSLGIPAPARAVAPLPKSLPGSPRLSGQAGR